MNIEKLAKHLKEFSLDEIEMIAECDCITEIEQLLNEHKLSFNNGLYKFIEQEIPKIFELIEKPKFKNDKPIFFKDFAIYYLQNRDLTKSTYKGYKTLLKTNLIPYFYQKHLNEITYNMITEFMKAMKKKYRPKTASNGVTLLGSILKYAFELGLIEHNPYYGVKNSMCK